MYTCDQALELLSARLDGALTPQESAGLEEHLARCPDCRALAADLAELHAAIPGLYQEPPPELKERVMAQIRAESAPISLEEVRKKHSGRKRWRSWGAMAAVMAVVFMSAVTMRFGGNGGDTAGIPENAPVQSAAPFSAQPEASQSAAADSLPAQEKAAVSDGENDTQSEPSVGGTEGTQIQPAQEDAQTAGGDGTGGSVTGAQASQPPQNSGQTEQPAEEGQTPGVMPFRSADAADTSQESGGVSALQTAIDPAAAAAGRIYEEILSADWPTGTAAADERLTGYCLTSADGTQTAVLRYLRESENGAYSIFKLYTQADGDDGDTLNFYAVPLEGNGEILTAWADNTPGDDAAFWKAVDE